MNYVVYLYIPTSNHNGLGLYVHNERLYIFIFLHQTTTIDSLKCDATSLYIFIFLHQTTTPMPYVLQLRRCISLYSYIKPQLILSNWFRILSCISLYSYIKPQQQLVYKGQQLVVYLYIPTSNHNGHNGR